jgi:DNA-binding CsgD family transcriptional regulator
MNAEPAIQTISAEAGVLVGREMECRVLSGLVDDVVRGRGGALVVVGEVGVGKSALLDCVCAAAGVAGVSVLRVAGVRAERGFAFAGLQRLLGAVFAEVGAGLDADVRSVLGVVLGTGLVAESVDTSAVEAGVLALLRLVAVRSPVVCVVDDQHWMDRASMEVLALVGRRVINDQVGLVVSSAGMPVELEEWERLPVAGLSTRHAGQVLDAALAGPLDPAVRRQIVAEAGGSPAVLVELARAVGPFGLAGGYAFPGAMSVAEHIEAGYRARLGRLPEPSRRLVQVAAADPVGDPRRLWAAAELLGLNRTCLPPVLEDGFMAVDSRVRFVHPFARCVAYRAGSAQERRAAHAALAAVTDAASDPDRHAWHRSEAADGPDESIARDLDGAVAAARRRGGLAAVAAFRTKAAMLTPGRIHQVERLVSAAEATRDAGALDAALDLLELVGPATAADHKSGRMARLRGGIALMQRCTAEAVPNLLDAAAALTMYDPSEAREVCLEALPGSLWVTVGAQASGVAEAISPMSRHGAAPVPEDDMVAPILNGLHALVVERRTSAVPALRQAVDLLVADTDGPCPTLATIHAVLMAPIALWDDYTWELLVQRVIGRARRDGALAVLSCALDFLAVRLMWAGDLAAAARVVAQAAWLHSQTTGAATPHLRMMLAAWEGDEAEAQRLGTEIRTEIRTGPAAGPSATALLADYAEAVLGNGTGHFEQAHSAALRVFDADLPVVGTLVASELADAASRTGAVEDLKRLDVWLRAAVRTTPGPWATGLAERVTALLSADEEAEDHYLRSITHLGKTGSRTELARSELLYGEWLRRQGRRGRARQVLREARSRFRDAGARAFAERAVRELRAAGDPAVSDAGPDYEWLTAQEAQIARLAAEGLTNPEIGARLFISSRTVQYHLRSVFQKLGIASRSQLAQALAPRQAGGRTSGGEELQ